jgi:predicted DNA-binding transcriptional regulator YafY
MRADRLLSLILLLQAHRRLTAPALARRLEVSVRTVLRDVEALAAAGIPVYTERGRDGGIRLLDGYRPGLTSLTDAEAASLVVGQPRLAADLGLADALDTAIQKLAGAGGRSLRGGMDRGRSAVLVDVDPWMRTAEPVPQLPVIHDAITLGRRIELDYQDSQAAQRTVRVDPLGLVAKAGLWYVIATTAAQPGRSSAAPDLFRVSRVRSCRILPDPATRPSGFELAQAWAELRDTAQARRRELPVLIAVTPTALAMARRLLASKLASDDAAVPVEPGPQGGRHVLRLTFAGVGEAVGMLLGLGNRIEVLRPRSVRTALLRSAQDIVDLYRPLG